MSACAQAALTAPASAGRLRRVADALARPGGLAWTVALGLAASAALLETLEPSHLAAAGVAATAVFALATTGLWRGDRRRAETALLGASLLLLTLLVLRLPAALQTGLTPVAALLASLGVLTWSEWRFAADAGQSGFGWALSEGAFRTFWCGLGIASGLFFCVVAQRAHGPLAVSIQALGALPGYAFGCLITPTRYASDVVPVLTRGVERALSSDETAADWWKHPSGPQP